MDWTGHSLLALIVKKKSYSLCCVRIVIDMLGHRPYVKVTHQNIFANWYNCNTTGIDVFQIEEKVHIIGNVCQSKEIPRAVEASVCCNIPVKLLSKHLCLWLQIIAIAGFACKGRHLFLKKTCKYRLVTGHADKISDLCYGIVTFCSPTMEENNQTSILF